MTINTVVFTFLLALTPLLVSCVDDIAFFAENGHYYQFVRTDKPISYDDARTLSSARNHNKQQGYAVTIGSATEQAFLNSYLAQIGAVSATNGDWPTIWGGAVRTNNLWNWNALGRISTAFYDTNTLQCYQYGYCNWNVSNNATSFPTDRTCLQIYLNNTNGPTPGQWRPATCSSTTSPALVVEYDASTTCSAGYVYRTSKGWCEDVNECTNNPNICGAGYRCSNTIGSYNCVDIDECAENATICRQGFQCVNGNGSYSCVDINECAATPSVCASGYDCQNTFGSYTCSDINECNLNSSLCTKGYVCQNTPGSYVCNDIDECAQGQQCPFGTSCANTIGSYTCDAKYYIIQSSWNKLVMDFIIVDGVARLITNVMSNSITQLWSFTPSGFIINAKNNYVVDAEGGLPYPGVKVILWPQKVLQQAGNQLWDYEPSTKYWSSAGTTDDVLDIFHGVNATGAEICLFTPKNPSDTPEGNSNQMWDLIETPFVVGGTN